MQPSPNTRRHSDGSIDFDFYRRQAARRRRAARRSVVKACLAMAAGTLRAGAALVVDLTIGLARRTGRGEGDRASRYSFGSSPR